MKTSSNDVLCDACRDVIAALDPDALRVKIQMVGAHIYADLCDDLCFISWAGEFSSRRGAGERGPE